MKLSANWKGVLDYHTNSSRNECTHLLLTYWPKSLQSTWLTAWFVEWGTFPLTVTIMIRGVATEWKLGVWMWIGYIIHELTTEVHDALSKKVFSRLNLNGSDTCSEALVQAQASMPTSTSHGEMVEPSHCNSKYHKHIPQKTDLITYPPNQCMAI